MSTTVSVLLIGWPMVLATLPRSLLESQGNTPGNYITDYHCPVLVILGGIMLPSKV